MASNFQFHANYHIQVCFAGIFRIEDVTSEKLEKETTQRAASEQIVTDNYFETKQEQTMGSQAGDACYKHKHIFLS